jgi:hypothetical protein
MKMGYDKVSYSHSCRDVEEKNEIFLYEFEKVNSSAVLFFLFFVFVIFVFRLRFRNLPGR